MKVYDEKENKWTESVGIGEYYEGKCVDDKHIWRFMPEFIEKEIGVQFICCLCGFVDEWLLK